MGDTVTLIVSILSALTALYGVWLSGHKTRAEASRITAEAKKITEEAESEDARQKGIEIENLNAIIAQWNDQYGGIVKRLDLVRAELDTEIARRRTVEEQSASKIHDLEAQLEAEHYARIEAEKRARAQANHLADLQSRTTQMQDVIDSQHATISSLRSTNEEKELEIRNLRRDLQEEKLKRSELEVRLNTIQQKLRTYDDKRNGHSDIPGN